jgi:hypothetical protein
MRLHLAIAVVAMPMLLSACAARQHSASAGVPELVAVRPPPAEARSSSNPELAPIARAQIQTVHRPADPSLGFPSGTVLTQIVPGPILRRERSLRMTDVTRTVLWIFRDCSSNPACRDYLMLFTQTTGASIRRAWTRAIDELTAQPAKVVEPGVYVRLAGDGSSFGANGVFELKASNASGPFTFCIWPNGSRGYRAHTLPASSPDQIACPEQPIGN